jgi:hypothetical protein
VCLFFILPHTKKKTPPPPTFFPGPEPTAKDKT